MKPIIKWTLRQRRWSTIWWTVGASFLTVFTLAFYPSFKDQADQFDKTFSDLPDAAVQLFGGSTDFFSPIGYLNSQIFFIVLPLLFSMLAVVLAGALIAREEQDKTIETLLSRPVSRTRLLSAKMITGTIILAIVCAASGLATVLGALAYDIDVPLGNVAAATFVCFLLAWCTGAISFLLTATGKARSAALGVGAAIGLGGYLISSLAGTVDWLETPSKIFPFYYYQSEAILNGTYHWINIMYFIVVVAACAMFSIIVFRRRDIE